MHNPTPSRRLPGWFKVRLSTNERYSAVRSLVRERNLRTVCESAACPNRNECWNAGTATFLIIGEVCTRRCGFCNIPSGCPAEPDRGEPKRVADAVASLGLSYAVITSVTRDDLHDGGAGLFADTIRAIRMRTPHCRVEVLVPDFRGMPMPLDTVLNASPHVLNHNIETVPSLYPRVRPQANYDRSLQLLRSANDRNAVTKSGIMLGLGESWEEVRSVLRDLRGAGCDMVTLGQYLQPSREHLSVQRYYRPEEFEWLRSIAIDLGFRYVASGPLVRSSYRSALSFTREE
jgi:lipoyl synthase